jgi:hypothetical protein
MSVLKCVVFIGAISLSSALVFLVPHVVYELMKVIGTDVSSTIQKMTSLVCIVLWFYLCIVYGVPKAIALSDESVRILESLSKDRREDGTASRVRKA